MGKDIKEQSTEETKEESQDRQSHIDCLLVCNNYRCCDHPIYMGNHRLLPAYSAGFAGLGIVTIAMSIGGMRIKEEIARRNDSQKRTVD